MPRYRQYQKNKPKLICHTMTCCHMISIVFDLWVGTTFGKDHVIGTTFGKDHLVGPNFW